MPNKILQKQRQTIDTRLHIISAAFAYFLLVQALLIISGNILFATENNPKNNSKSNINNNTNNYSENKNKTRAQDSLRFTAPEIIILGNRISNNPAVRLTSSQYFSSEQMEKIPALQISDVIDKAPGVYIKNYGGAGGMKTVNIRGTNASQNLIMLDGVPLNSKQNASFDLSILPLSFVNEIEIVRGGASDLFGSNAMGGAVNLLSSSQRNRLFKVSYAYASYNEHKFSFSTPSFGANGFDCSISGGLVHSDGNYQFKFNEYGAEKTLSRENAKFQNLGLFFNSGYIINNDNYLSFKMINTYTDRGVPGAVLQNRLESKYASLSDFSNFSNLSYNLSVSKNDLLKISLVAKYNNQKYQDEQPNAIETLRNAQFINTEFAILANNAFSMNLSSLLNLKINSSIDYTYSRLNGDMLDKSVGREVNRANLSIANFIENSIELAKNHYFTMAPSLRIDIYNALQPAYSYGLSLMYSLPIDEANLFPLNLKLRYSRNFRVPSFNELYYYNYGTADLLPEKSHSFDYAMSLNLSKYFAIELSTYYIDTKDQIISVPKNTISWSAMNLGKVETKGIEALLKFKLIDEIIDGSLAYTLQSVRDKSPNSLNYDKYVIYTPQEIINGTININIKPITLQINGEYSSHRFALPDNSYSSMLPNYFILNSAVFYRFNLFDKNCRMQLECKNILDKNYQVIINYPMPSRIFRIGLDMDV